MKTIYLDESGDHDLINLDPNYPAFVLAGCIIDDEHHNNFLVPTLNKFKKNLFGTKDLVLHYVDYTRNKCGFEKVKQEAFRNKFFDGLNNIIKETDFTLIACIIDKKLHREHYKNAIDPYLLSLEVIMEKFVMYLNSQNEQGTIIAESRGSQLDNALNLAFLDLKISGSRFLTPKAIVNRLGNNFFIKKKEENIAGLQLVDSLVTPIGRRYLGLKNRCLDYDGIKSKFRKIDCGRYRGYGLVILPSQK